MASINLPVYASKTRRAIPGTSLTAVTMFASADKSVREYTIFNADGEAIGRVKYSKANRAIYRGTEFRTNLGNMGFRSLYEAARSLVNVSGR